MPSSRLKNGLSEKDLTDDDLLFPNGFHETKGAVANLSSGVLFQKRTVREHDKYVGSKYYLV